MRFQGIVVVLLIVVFLPLVTAVEFNTDVILNTTVSNSSITFSFGVNITSIVINSGEINLTNVTYNDGSLRSCNINFSTDNTNLDSADFNCALVDGDTTLPNFTNLINHTESVNTSFGYDIDADDNEGISSFTINDTNYFEINTSGYITNNTDLNEVILHFINITVNDTSNNLYSEVFYIHIVTPPGVLTTIRGIYPQESLKVPYIKLGEHLEFK